MAPLIEMKPEWEWLTKTIYDPAIFWAMVTTAATIAFPLPQACMVGQPQPD